MRWSAGPRLFPCAWGVLVAALVAGVTGCNDDPTLPPVDVGAPADHGGHAYSLVTGRPWADTCCGILSVVGGDVNGDGHLDVGVLHPHYHGAGMEKQLGVALVYGNDRSATWGYDSYFMDGSPVSFEPGRSFATVAAADLDGDAAHRLEVVGIDHQVLRRAYFAGDKVLAAADLLPLDVTAQRLLLGDLTADGRPDVVLEYGDSPSALRMRVHANRGDGTFGADVLGDATGDLGALPLLADLDGDGVAELLGAEAAASAGLLVQGFTAQGGFAVRQRARFDEDGRGHALALRAGDLDGDGRPDLVVSEALEQGGGRLVVLRADGRGGLRRGLATPTPTALRDFGIADLDGDGAMDVIAISDREPWDIALLFGAGDGTFDSARNLPSEQAQALVLDEDKAGDRIPDVMLVVSGAFVGPDHVRGQAGRR